MGKYKIGDRVRVRSDMTVGERYGLILTSIMSTYAGIETTIVAAHEFNSYFLAIEGTRFYWHEDMLEPVSKFKVGDKVRVKVRTGDDYDYPCSFTDGMTNLSGKEFQIVGVNILEGYDECKYYEEPYKYTLNDSSFIWSSPMLELVAPANEITSVISDRCGTAGGSISTADYVVDGVCIVPASSEKSKSEYVPDYKLETQNNYNLNFNLK